ncbi:uncharacterized protein LOC115631271 [Scaptodrosophila lebanonensis]|uniref:Uncharacterized protein LOC115631271 n=1 Tax=Drosophila lebanonensis TaxID=7225 RepID=A0A6J2U8H7_DROLE|nr:uncharacterized protein LOC115631271 [Scaptodrosophila lebanonensis]
MLPKKFSGEIGKIKSQGGDDENHDEPYWFSKLMFLEPHLRLRKPTNSSLAVKMEEDFRLQTSGTKRLKTDISILQSEVKLKPNMAALSWDEPEPKIEADEVENQMDSENRKTEKMGEMPQTFVRPCPTRMFTDVIEAFGEYIKAELAELPTEQQAEIRRKIVKTMFETQSE